MTFREFLQNKFAEQYIGLDDQMPSAEIDWFSCLDIDEIIDYADEWYKQK